MEEAPLKGLYALAFALISFAACAQSPDVPTVRYFDLDDYFGEVTELSALQPQSITIEPTIGRGNDAADETDGVAKSGEQDPENAPVGAIEPSDATAVVQSPLWWDDRLSFEDEIEPSTVPAQIAAESTMDTIGEKSASADSIAIAAATDVPVGGIEPRHQTAAASWSPSDDKMMIGEASGQSEELPEAF
jgi:hypothetical protein